MDTQRAIRLVPGIVLALTFFSAAQASAQGNLAAEYAGWAGGKANADALVRGLRHGATITLSTRGPDRTVSLAGFTPPVRLADAEIAAALATARATLGRLGIARPTAEQIQAALIGGEVRLASGAVRVVRGSVGDGAAPEVVATR